MNTGFVVTNSDVGGLECEFYFPIQLGIIIPTDFRIFQRGWNHQPLMDFCWKSYWNFVGVGFDGISWNLMWLSVFEKLYFLQKKRGERTERQKERVGYPYSQEIFPMNSGEPFGATNRASQPSSSYGIGIWWDLMWGSSEIQWCFDMTLVVIEWWFDGIFTNSKGGICVYWLFNQADWGFIF